MGHCVTAIVGKPEALREFAAGKGLPAPVALVPDLAMIPLRDRELDAILPLPLTGEVDDFVYLSDQLQSVLADLSRRGRVMYLETDYFGGAGTQGAVVYQDGIAIYGPRSAGVGPISEGLALLGVKVQPPARDEFDSVGLGRKRSTAAWLDLDDDDDA